MKKKLLSICSRTYCRDADEEVYELVSLFPRKCLVCSGLRIHLWEMPSMEFHTDQSHHTLHFVTLFLLVLPFPLIYVFVCIPTSLADYVHTQLLWCPKSSSRIYKPNGWGQKVNTTERVMGSHCLGSFLMLIVFHADGRCNQRTILSSFSGYWVSQAC